MEFSTGHPSSEQQRGLLGLAVFQNAHQLEYIRSVHVFKEEGSIHAIQQEYLMCNKAGTMTSMNPATHMARFSSEAAFKPYMAMLRQQHQSGDWKCLLDLCVDPPHAIPLQRNGPNRDPHSYTQPLFTIETLVETMGINSNVLFAHVINAHKDPSNILRCPPFIVPSSSLDVCVQSQEATNEEPDQHVAPLESPRAMPHKLQLVDMWQQWGSDLELASPRISQTFDVPLMRNNAIDPHAALGHNHQVMPLDVTHEACGTSTSFAKDIMLPHVPFINSMRGSNTIANLSSMCGTSPINFTRAVQLDQSDSWNRPHLTSEITHQATSSMSHSYNSEKGPQAGMDHPTSTGFCSQMYSAISRSAKDEAKLVAGYREMSQRKESPSAHKSNVPRASSSRLTDLTKDELSHYFNMPITQASKELKVGLTVLKKRCRIFGIPRWPHRKMKSLNSLIHNIKHLVKGDGEHDNEANRVQFAVEELEKQRKAMQDSPAIQLPERTKRLRQACFKASYRKRRQGIDKHHTNMTYNINSSNHNSSSSSSSSNRSCG